MTLSARASASLLFVLLAACLAGCAGNSPGPREMARYESAIGLYEKKEYDDALKQIRSVQVHYPLWAEGCLLYSKCARATGTIEGRRLAAAAMKRLVAHFPDRADLRRELASLYYEQGFLDYAKIQYETLLGMNAKDSNAHYMLGLITERDWKRYHNTLDLSRMISEFSRAVELDSSSLDSFKRLVRAYLEKEDPDSVALISSRLLARVPADRDALLLCALGLHQKSLYEEELGLWEKYFALSDSVSMVPFNDITPLLTPAQKARFKRLDATSKTYFTRKFWKELDPDPTTELNERILEHWYRIGLSRELYSDEKVRLPGWLSGRGQVLVRYGRPLAKDYTIALSERKNVGLPALIWYYSDDTGDFSIAFVDYNLSGNFTYMAFSQFPSAMDERLYYRPTTYQHDYRADVYQNFFATAGFLRGGGVNEEFYVGVPLERLARRDWRQVPIEFAVFDTLWNNVVRASTTLESAKIFAEAGAGATLIRELDFRLRPDEYIVAVTVRDTSSGTLGLTKERVNVPDLSMDTLGVSEIELAYLIPAKRQSLGISKDEGILANPSSSYITPEPLRLYYEVYNLARGPDGKCHFITNYSIVPYKKKGSLFWEFVTSLFSPGQHYIVSKIERQVERQSSSEQLSIDVSTLKDGSYRLILEIQDTVSKQRAKTERTFEKLPRIG